jgi:uncharacterized protein (TIGR02246 family)
MNEWADKLAIQELCSRYCHTNDSQDSEGWARCFTPDGAFEFDGSVVRGHDALREYAEAHARVMRCRHMTLNHLYQVDGNKATGQSTTVVTLATEGGYKIFGQGKYQDRLLKQDGKWRFVHRCVNTDRLVSDPQKAINLADPDVAALVRQLIEAARRLGGKDNG